MIHKNNNKIGLHNMHLALAVGAISLGACTTSDSDSGADQATPAVTGPGTLQLEIMNFRAGSIQTIDFSVFKPNGTALQVSQLTLANGATKATGLLTLPAGLGYSITLSATDTEGTKCSGQGTFNVLAGQTTNLSLRLKCGSVNDGNNNGDVKVEVEIEPGDPGSCPDISFISALPQRVNVGGKIRLRSAATLASATFAWSSPSGSFSAATSSDTDYTCSQEGKSDITLTVTTTPGCEDSHVISVDCLSSGTGTGTGSGSGALNKSQACGAIVSACHAKDPKDGGPISTCHDLGHAGVEAKCQPEQSRCVELCNAAPLPKQEFRLNFEPKVGSEAFNCATTYNGLGTDNGSASPSDFRFYLYDVKLIAADGTETNMEIPDRDAWQWSGVGLVDFENGPSNQCFGGTPETNTFITGTAPKGDYVGLSFRLGIPQNLNHADPNNLQGPLKAGGMAWNWLAGFKYVKFELGAAVFHVGSTACSGTPPNSVNCGKSNRGKIILSSFNAETNKIIVDLAAAFKSSTMASNPPSCHSTAADACQALFSEVGIDFATGAPTSAQSVFRVE